MDDLLELIVKVTGVITIALLVVFVFSLLLAFPVMWLWNWLMPTIFGLIKINIWQALGLNLLSSFLIQSSYTKVKK